VKIVACVGDNKNIVTPRKNVNFEVTLTEYADVAIRERNELIYKIYISKKIFSIVLIFLIYFFYSYTY